MRRLGSCFAMTVLVSTLAIGGCGGDRGDRGLTPPDEVATPGSAAADAETAQQRQGQLTDEMQQLQIEEFDESEKNAGKQPMEQPAP